MPLYGELTLADNRYTNRLNVLLVVVGDVVFALCGIVWVEVVPSFCQMKHNLVPALTLQANTFEGFLHQGRLAFPGAGYDAEIGCMIDFVCRRCRYGQDVCGNCEQYAQALGGVHVYEILFVFFGEIFVEQERSDERTGDGTAKDAQFGVGQQP